MPTKPFPTINTLQLAIRANQEDTRAEDDLGQIVGLNFDKCCQHFGVNLSAEERTQHVDNLTRVAIAFAFCFSRNPSLIPENAQLVFASQVMQLIAVFTQHLKASSEVK